MKGKKTLNLKTKQFCHSEHLCARCVFVQVTMSDLFWKICDLMYQNNHSDLHGGVRLALTRKILGLGVSIAVNSCINVTLNYHTYYVNKSGSQICKT